MEASWILSRGVQELKPGVSSNVKDRSSGVRWKLGSWMQWVEWERSLTGKLRITNE